MRSRAELYDWELAHVAGRLRQDLAFYSGLAPRGGGSVLELACGTGRLTVPLDAVGLDIDGAMLGVARRRGARTLVRADMRRFALARHFDLVVIAYNSLQLLVDDDDLVACLRCAASHLGPDGVIALEVTDFQAGASGASVAPERLAGAEGVTLHGGLVHDLTRRITTYHRRVREGNDVRVDHVALRCLDRVELETLLRWAGLGVVEMAGAQPGVFCVARRQGGDGDHDPAYGSAVSRRTMALATRVPARLD
ncbi:MAG: class I SAM-dependent methyltransferase [Actinomycetota bacterium]|nr:class I SAM-dependent methyltransferase [Actinomycetota bacterium]